MSPVKPASICTHTTLHYTMYAFKSLSLSTAVFLLALLQGALSQPTELVPLGGQCGTIIGTLPCVAGAQCCYLNPDNGMYVVDLFSLIHSPQLIEMIVSFLFQLSAQMSQEIHLTTPT
ncbi:hypothetical protein R3P38DRAFT_3176952 [Favolaschia claudopus]|uniref:Hydrophobin n=1 Tax=Favolaschia claudopus TaxID=2862362 RepID=A0AAW0CZS6_9AGAR